MPDRPKTGAVYVFGADQALGAQHLDDPADQPRDMRELDLQPGTEVTALGFDGGRGLALIEWVDKAGTPRITSVEPDHFTRHFTRKG